MNDQYSDIPYGISIDKWDVLHNNKNSALLGQSPAQVGKTGFKRRGKPISGWSTSDRQNMGKEYEAWCRTWVSVVKPKMKVGSSLFVFGSRRMINRVINAFEDSGFVLKDILAWKKSVAHHRAQRISGILEKRGNLEDAKKWEGWRLGNLAPVYEPIAWFVKPQSISTMITDNVLENELGAINIADCQVNGRSPSNMLEIDFAKGEERVFETQKPLALMEFLIRLTTRKGQLVLDPFVGSGTTAIAASRLERHFVAFENIEETYRLANERLK
jgi:site-specific DNA-methyltransferase (adenine-specific)